MSVFIFFHNILKFCFLLSLFMLFITFMSYFLFFHIVLLSDILTFSVVFDALIFVLTLFCSSEYSALNAIYFMITSTRHFIHFMFLKQKTLQSQFSSKASFIKFASKISFQDSDSID